MDAGKPTDVRQNEARLTGHEERIDDLSERVGWIEAQVEVGEELITGRLCRLEEIAVRLERVARGLPPP